MRDVCLSVNNLYPGEIRLQYVLSQPGVLWGLCEQIWHRVWFSLLGWNVYRMRVYLILDFVSSLKSLPCVRSWRVLTSSRTRSCRTCCRMCCLWASCMIPILSSFLSVNLMRARPAWDKKKKDKTSVKVKGQTEQEASGNSTHTAGDALKGYR